MKTIKILAIIPLVFLLVQCKCNRQEETNSAKSIDSLSNDTIEKTSFILPAPEQVLSDILPGDITINQQLPNPLSNASQYTVTKSQALNLGVYVADFAYLNLSENKANALEYFKTIRDLSQKINIYGYFDDAFFNRVIANLTNNDSLIAIANDMYFEMSETLENSDRNEIYALISAGAFIETLYLSTMTITNFSEYKSVAQDLFNQKYLFNSMNDFLIQYKADSDVQSVITILDNLKQILDKQDKVSAEKKISKDKKNHITISRAKNKAPNEEMFNELKSVIIKTRSEIVGK